MVRRELPRLGTRRSYASYSSIVQKIVVPYFEKKAIPLAELKAIDIQAFYLKQRWIAPKPPRLSAAFTTAPKSRSSLKPQKGVSLKSPSFSERFIRYHDLRHSCASLLLANGVPMKQIQEWLGHSDFSTTANVYAHLECNSKRLSAAAMTNGLQDALNAIS